MSENILNQDIKLSKTMLVGDLSDFSEPVFLYKVNNTEKEAIWDDMVRKNHYLGFGSMIGGRVKYLVTLGAILVGAISFCSAAYKLGPRDLFIGWDEKTRLEYLPHLLNNNRFLILPWINVHNLASHVLSLSLKRVCADWEEQYGVEPYMVETFVDPKLFNGTCYVAANWTYLGVTKGFGRVGNSFIYHGQEKEIYVYVMNHRFNKIFKPDTSRLLNERDEILGLITDMPMHYECILKDTDIANIGSINVDILFADHIMRYTQYLGRKEHKLHLVAILKGLLSDLKRKTLGQIAIAFEGDGDVRNMTYFVTQSIFDHEGMLEEYQKDLSEILSHQIGMFTGDTCDFERDGNLSVGIAHQYSSYTGKMCNCQSSVMAGYSSPEGFGMIDYTLYMPNQWFKVDFKSLRRRCQVPKDLKYLTKNQILLMMINKAKESGNFQGKYIGVDSSFGDDQTFLDSISKNFVYFAEISDTTLVFNGHQDILISNEYYENSKFSMLKSLNLCKVRDIVTDESYPWKSTVLDIVENGPIIVLDKCIKVIECRDGKPARPIWLYVRRLKDDSMIYALCNESVDSPPETVRTAALMRWPIKQCIRDYRKRLGMDQYEVRSWPGWRRHMLFTFIANLFSMKLKKLSLIKTTKTNATKN